MKDREDMEDRLDSTPLERLKSAYPKVLAMAENEKYTPETRAIAKEHADEIREIILRRDMHSRRKL